MDSASTLEKVLTPLLWDVIKSLQLEFECDSEIQREEGRRTCRVCPSPMVVTRPCSCCGQAIHEKCSINKTCKTGCQKIQVKIFPKIRKELEVQNLGESEFYHRMMTMMRRTCVLRMKAEIIKTNEEIFKNMTEEFKKRKEEEPSPVVTTRVKRLQSYPGEKIDRLGARHKVTGDPTLKSFSEAVILKSRRNLLLLR